MNLSNVGAASSNFAFAAQTGTGQARSGTRNGSGDEAAIARLKARDRQVRQHEQAHLAAAGGLATSGASYTYQRGPDGVNYAVGGEVNIDVSPGRDPGETIRRARQIRAAALAPADPSGQDRAVAAQAARMEQQARAELAQERQDAPDSRGGTDAGAQARIGRHYDNERAPALIDTYA